MRSHRSKNWLIVTMAVIGATAGLDEVRASAVGPSWQGKSLAEMDLEELGNIQITSVSKQPEILADAPASIFVITAEDLRHAGVSTLPEALRLAPNLEVAQISASQYAIGARGFNGFRSNKLLVMIDGHTVYSPTAAIVFWDRQMVMLEDIERIEVISGPGGTLWGLNAVNGVINVITKTAHETQGMLAVVGVGQGGNDISFRHGSSVGEPVDGKNGTHFRVFGQSLSSRDSSSLNGQPVNDGFVQAQAGFRADGSSTHDQWTALGKAYEVRAGQPPPGFFALPGTAAPSQDLQTSGLNLTGRWVHRLNEGSDLEVQAYLDHSRRNIPGVLNDAVDIIDLQLQHALQAAQNHRLVWGAEYRLARNRVSHSQAVTFLPDSVEQNWASLFAQDEWVLHPRLRWTVGTRVETNPYTHPEFMPSTRLAWKIAPAHLLWAAVSRAGRSPSRTDVDLRFPANPPYFQSGTDHFRSEVATVYELGYRGQPTDKLSSSFTVFQAEYDHLLTLEPGPNGNQFANKRQGTTRGIEWWGTLQAAPRWRLSAGLSALKKDLRLDVGAVDLGVGTGRNGNDPDVSWNLRSNLTLSAHWDLDAAIRRVSSLPNPVVAAYVVGDVRLGWRPHPGLELSLTGNNLFSGKHEEFALTNIVNPRVAVGPGVGLKLVSRF